MINENNILDLLPFEVEDYNAYEKHLLACNDVDEFLHMLYISPLDFIKDTLDDYVNNNVPIDYLVDIVDLKPAHAIHYIVQNHQNFNELPKKFKRDSSFLYSAIEYSPEILKYIDDDLIDFNLCHKAVHYQPRAIKHVPEVFLTEQIFISSLENYEHSDKFNHWHYVPFNLEADLEFIITAIHASPNIYLDFPKELKENPYIVKEALSINGDLITQIPKQLQTEENILIAAKTVIGRTTILDIAPQLFSNEKTMISLLNISLNYLSYMGHDLKNNLNVANETFKNPNKSFSIEHFGQSIKSNRKIAVNAIACGMKNLGFIDRAFLKDESFLHDVIKNTNFNKFHLDFFDKTIIKTPQVVIDMIGKSKPCLNELKDIIKNNPSRQDIIYHILSADKYCNDNFANFMHMIEKIDLRKDDSQILLKSIKSYFNTDKLSNINKASEINTIVNYITDKEFKEFLTIHPPFNYLLSLDLDLITKQHNNQTSKKLKL